MRVLIADDDPVSRAVLEAALRRLGHECAVTADGLSAWRAFSSVQPDVLITDWQMPGLDGTELVSRVRGACAAAYTYVVVLTGRAGEDAARASMSAGADDLMRKPLNPGELERKLIAAERLIDLHERLRHDADSDALTGIGNRRRLVADLTGHHARAIRHHRSYGIAIADVDRFKAFNDGAGHLQGDEVLRRVAETLASTARAADSIYRYGGEEFVGLLPELTVAGAMSAAMRWQAAIEESHDPSSRGRDGHGQRRPRRPPAGRGETRGGPCPRRRGALCRQGTRRESDRPGARSRLSARWIAARCGRASRGCLEMASARARPARGDHEDAFPRRAGGNGFPPRPRIAFPSNSCRRPNAAGVIERWDCVL